MAIDIKFDLMNNPEPPTIILATRSGNKLGQLNVNTDSIDLSDNLVEASEFSFTVNKYVDSKLTPLWDKLVDFKLVYCREWDKWFEITVELDEATETIKTVLCTQLGQAELSQIMLYGIEINTEADISRDDYKITILYDENEPKSSMLHRLLEKAPHYSIAYVDPTIRRIQRSFSFDDTSICDAFNRIGEEIGCLFEYDSNSDAHGMPKRTVSVYDLQQNCNNKDCRHRGEFTNKCPKCGGTDITYGYGEDTTIFVTSDELATEGIQLVTDTDSVKNCFKLEGGDDLMTATIRNCNPNGSDYIWYFSDAVKADMSDELVNKIESYDALYKDYYSNHTSALDTNLLTKYNALVEKYKKYYNTPSTCLNCDYEGHFEGECPQCGSGNVLAGKSLQTISTPIIGYSSLMNAYYNTIDLASYLKSSLMPNIEMSDTSAKEQVALLNTLTLSPVGIDTKNIISVSRATANSAVLSMAKVIVKSVYKVEIENSETTELIDNGNGTKTWKGKFIVTNYSDEEDTATSEQLISVIINGDEETFIKQKIEKSLNKEDTDDYSISGLFKKEYGDFCNELKKYALTPLTAFQDACEACISILIAQKIGEDTTSDLYKNLYAPYSDKLDAIQAEMKIREDEINLIVGIYNDEGKLVTAGLQTSIESSKSQIQSTLNFESYLGEDLWLEFCAYRREDKYSNDNYISDGLNNAELFAKALEFIEVAENEIFKSAELQHSISTTVNNLLAIPKFKNLVKSFKVGNWIRVRINDEIYKLRLLKYDISYGDFNNIPVEFSDITKIKNGTTDVQNILSQASSMASSYDSVQRQAKKGNVAQGTIEQWIEDGLNSANVQIQSNDSEEITITKSGLLGRSYSDITGTYSPEQFKLTHNIMAYTTDGWKTVSSALGKHNYKYWKDGSFVDAEDYGLTSKFVNAGYITGSQIISGEIVSSNYEPHTKGTYFDLNKGDFEIAGGKIAYNATSDIVTLDGVTIVWDNGSTNAPTIAHIDGLSDALDKLGDLSEDAEQSAKDYTDSAISEFDSCVAQYFGLGGDTIVGDNYVISPYIGGGYLNIANTNNNSRVIIDPNNLTGNGYIFQVHNGDKVTVGVKSSGDSEFSGKITASDFVGGSLLIGDTTKAGDYAEIANDGTLTCTNVDIRGGVFKIGSEYDDAGNPIAHTWISEDGVLTTYDANIQGTLRSPTVIGGTIIGKSTLKVGEYVDANGETDYYTQISEDGIISAVEGVFEDCTITGGSLKMGNDEDGYSAWISVEDGVLHAYGAYLEEVNAVSGEIGGCSIVNGVLKVANANISEVSADKIDVDDLKAFQAKIGGFTIGDASIYHTKTSYNGTDKDGVYLGIDGIGLGKGKFYVDASGSLVSQKADITGVITATTGYIGYQDDNNMGWKISANKISGGGVSLYTGSSYTENGKYMRISVGDNTNLNANPFKVFNDGYVISSYGQIGSCAFSEIRYPVVGQDLENISTYSGHKVVPIMVGNLSKYRLDYKVRFHPNDTYETKEFINVEAWRKDGVADTVLDNDVYDWYYAWVDSASDILSWDDANWIYCDGTWDFDSFLDMDLSIIDTKPYLCLKAVGYRQGVDGAVSQFTFRIGDFSAFQGTFTMGENGLTIGAETILRKAIRIQFEDDYGNLIGTWKLNGASISTSSDRNLKHDILPIDDNYTDLFDNLHPVKFKYNSGTSDRYHTGFIAQDVCGAIENAGLTTNDFAAYVEFLKANGDGVECGLRYEEFIALCVDQIQKLKRRVAELENK